MKTLAIGISVFFIGAFMLQSCDEAIRNCKTFNLDFTEWSIPDYGNVDSIIFIDQQLIEHKFSLSDTEYSEAYVDTLRGIDPMVEDITCCSTKSNIYRNEELELDLCFRYTYKDNLAQENRLLFDLGLRSTESESFARTNQLLVSSPVGRVDSIDQISQSGQIYDNALRFNVRSMRFDNFENAEKTIDTMYFRPPIGLIKIVFSDGRSWIRQK